MFDALQGMIQLLCSVLTKIMHKKQQPSDMHLIMHRNPKSQILQGYIELFNSKHCACVCRCVCVEFKWIIVVLLHFKDCGIV